ncbi:hypothetical protein SAMN05443144_12039 [Fodinibius roseus]|uniref:Uncharacterized protein n=1 Tax=Fodinibius roseus TaxID=1194090 RepID=A0A1M5HH17_9BACT|nr:hypothetical protein SAMN05443144_12039 [Fodinibius roseus]
MEIIDNEEKITSGRLIMQLIYQNPFPQKGFNYCFEQ